MARALHLTATLLALASCSGGTADAVGDPDAGAGHDAASGQDAGDAASDVTGEAADATPAAPWSFTTLREQTLTSNGAQVQIELLRADRPDGGRSYLLYEHARAAHAPLVVMDEPYAGIDWTGEDVDARWAAAGDGARPDVDAPGYDGDDLTLYTAQTPQAAIDANNVWRANGFASVHAYARFYAGGTLEDDALDAAAPYHFALSRPQEIDTTRMGSLGGSWGGMMAIFGATHAPAAAKPLAVAALSPPSDFVALWSWSKTTLPALYPSPSQVESFYSPYWRRATPTVGDPPGGSGALPFTAAGVCAGFSGKVLAAHDAWDLIIPVTQTEALAAACPQVKPLYWPRQAPVDYATAAIDHGPASSEGLLPTIFVLSYAFLLEQLAPASAPTLYSVASQPSLEIHLRLIVAEQRAGGDVSYIVPRLLELADPRLKLYLAEGGAPVDGATVVAGAVNAVWNTTFDAAGVRAQLATGLPAPP